MANDTRPIFDNFNGNVGVGTKNVPTTRLQVGGHVTPDTNVSYSLGLPSLQWSSSYISTMVSSQATASAAFRTPFAAITTLSASGVTASIIQFSSASNPPYVEGAVFYDWNEHTLTVYNDNNQVTHNLGQENLIKVFNPSVGALPAGMPVYISKSNAFGFPQVVPAQALGPIGLGGTSIGSTWNVAGVTDGYISGSSYGYICTVGVVHALTQSWAAGTTLWLSPYTSGTYVDSPPTASYEKYLVGVIIQSGSTTGTDLLVLPNPHSYGATSASYGVSASRAEFAQVASQSLAFVPGAQYFANYISASNGSFSGSFRGYLSGSATTASYVATASIAIQSYMADAATFALDSTFALSASCAQTASYFITTFITQSTVSSSFASSSMSASYYALGRSIVLCAAYTPILAGADVAEYLIPYSPVGDGTSPISWSIKRFTIRAQTAETSQSVVNIEKSIGPGIFNPILIGSLTLPAASYEAYSGSMPSQSLNSGDKIRFNVVNVGFSQNWTIITEISNA